MELRRINRENKKMIKYYEEKRKQLDSNGVDYHTTMKDPNNVIEIDNLKTYFFTDVGTVKAVDGVSFNIPRGKTVGVVGESGCGKSVTSLSVMGLVQRPSGQIVDGEIRYNNGDTAVDLTKLPTKEMQKLRGSDIAMIFQEPMTSLNPVFTIGYQLDETIELHNPGMSKKAVKDRSIEMLKLVGIARAEGIYDSYPHELSGGMRQRVMIAMALACDPKLIIADEPTTALDVTIQAQILDLLRELKDKIDASIMLITHDLGVVAEMADIVVVMYAGRVIEVGTVMDIFHNPKHPYTIGLLNSKPSIDKKTDRLYSIPGQVPNPINMPSYCYFRDRCDRCIDKCGQEYPPDFKVSDTQQVACWLYEKDVKENG
ncbi:MAG: ABC transporter ATP-binding protein [Clostridiales bacterium]|nr:ABC transporter ATP-binding protein [Clostridiales bacterium]